MMNPPTAWNWRRMYWVFAGAFLVGLLAGGMGVGKPAPVPPPSPSQGAPAEAHWSDK